MGIKMFCGEYGGHLEPCHLDFRQWVVRRSVAVLYEPGKPDKDGWKLAKKDGWKVVPVEVRKIAR